MPPRKNFGLMMLFEVIYKNFIQDHSGLFIFIVLFIVHNIALIQIIVLPLSFLTTDKLYLETLSIKSYESMILGLIELLPYTYMSMFPFLRLME